MTSIKKEKAPEKKQAARPAPIRKPPKLRLISERRACPCCAKMLCERRNVIRHIVTVHKFSKERAEELMVFAESQKS